MATPLSEHVSTSDYLERSSKDKHELFQGKIVAMADASISHNRIVSNVIGDLNRFLRGKDCEVFPSDLRVHIPSSESFTYPDVTILCGKPEMIDDKQDTIKNPTVIIEVMSPGTEQYDHGTKFFYYLQIPTLREYLLNDSTKVFAQTIRKQADASWMFDELNNIDQQFAIASIAHQISLKEIYANVVFADRFIAA